MKRLRLIRLPALILGIMLIVGGCASLDKARSLHRQGETEKALDMARELLDDGKDVKTRLGAIDLLEQIGGDRAGDILMPVLDDEVVAVKNAAITAIGRIGYAPAAKKLLQIGLTSQGQTYKAAAGAIRDLGPPAIDLLVERYSESADESEKERYQSLMLEVGPSVASGIAKNLAGKSYFENRTNFELLIAFKSPAVAEWLLKEIDNNEVAENVMEGLVKLGSRAIDPVMEKLKNMTTDGDSVTVRVRLITVLGQLKARRAVNLLEELTRDNHDRVRDAADLALRRIRGF